jgi:exosortase A
LKPDLEFDARSVPAAARTSTAPLLVLAVALALLLALYWPTVTLLTQTWSGSETFKHGWVVVPIALWLAWRDRQSVPLHAARPWWPALIGIVLAGMAWLVANVAGVASVQELGLVLMVQLTVVGVLGPVVARSIAFPLAFLFFAIPAGDFLIPSLIDWTADFTVFALRATGIPVLRDGNTFVIPSGTWSVVEACSGIRYLIASLMVGTLYAYLTYRSNVRRVLFVLAAIVVPIVANWLRAYFIVMLGHYSSNTLAVGVDHLIYGWIFFGLVIALMFWIGSFWREDEQSAAGTSVRARYGEWGLREATQARSGWAVALTAVALGAAWPAIARGIDARDDGAPVVLDLPAQVNGWQQVSSDKGDWAPSYSGAATTRLAVFEKDGREVKFYVAYYRRQRQGRELVSSSNVLVPATSTETRERLLAVMPLRWPGGGVDARASEIITPRARVLAARWYWIDGTLTSSDYEAKARHAAARLMFRGDDGAGVVLWTPRGEDAEEARATLEAFAREAGASIQAALVRARGAGA